MPYTALPVSWRSPYPRSVTPPSRWYCYCYQYVVCTRICADLDAVHCSPCWDRITCHPHMITCRPCRPAVSCYTPSPHDYMPSVPPKPKFLLLVMLESWHPTFARLLLHQAENFVIATNDESVYTSTVTTSMPSSLFRPLSMPSA